MNCVDQVVTDRYALYHADVCEAIRGIPDNSVDFIVYSPPFCSLYTYSASDRDLGNSTDEEFAEHYAFLVPQLLRVLKSGRLCSVHCMNLPTSKERDGYIGLKDFRGDLIRVHQASGFIYHSEVVIWKDPVTAMQRTKAIGLLHKQVVKDRSLSRQGIPDTLCTFRKPGENAEPIGGHLAGYIGEDVPRLEGDEYRDSIAIWQRYADPVWDDINPSKTLQRESAREEEDERHVCPLQLQVIERAVALWTNPGDVVLDPFGGIGSTGYQALKMGRKTIMTELKSSYFAQMVLNCANAIVESGQLDMFSEELAAVGA